MLYALTYYSGLGDIVRRDIQDRLGSVEVAETYLGRRHDTLVLRCGRDPAAILALRCAENLFALGGYFDGVRVSGPKGLARIDEACRNADLAGALRAVRNARGESACSRPTFVLTVNVIGRHNFAEAEAREVVLRHLGESGWREDHDRYEVNVRLQIVRDRGYIGLGMLRRPLSRRPYKIRTLAGSLDPTVAYCVASKTMPSRNDVFLDPMCGAGTLAIERALGWPHKAIYAGDVIEEAVAATRQNAEAAGCDLDLRKWDARQLPLGDGLIDKVAVNVPYGKDIALEPNVLGDVLCELARVTRPEGLVSLLTAHGRQIRRWVGEAQFFRLREELEVNLQGFRASMLLLERR